MHNTQAMTRQQQQITRRHLAHQSRGVTSPLLYRLIFDKRRVFRITLPAPAFFDLKTKRRYVITREEAEEYERRAEAARLHAAAQQAITTAHQYDPNYSSSSQYDPNNYYYGYPPGQPWP